MPSWQAASRCPPPTPLSAHLHDHYLRQVRALPEPTRRLMLLAAADPTGRRHPPVAGGPEAGSRTTRKRRRPRRNSWSRSAPGCGSGIPWCARPPTRRRHRRSARAAHRALAEATDTHVDPDRRMWHEAAAATEPDEAIAAALEEAAVRTQARAGSAAAAAFLQRSATLTTEPGRRADRALAAALANLHAGAFDTARGLLAQAESDAVHDLQRARVEQLRGQIEWASVAGRDAPVLLRQAATRLESLHVGLARETYLHAWVASTVAGPLAGPGGLLLEVSRAAQAAPQPDAGCATMRSPPRRSGDDGHPRARGRRADPAASGGRIPRRSRVRGRVAAVGHSRPDGGHGGVGLRQLGHVEHPTCRDRPRIGRAHPAVHRPERPRDGRHTVRRPRDGDVAGRGEGRDQRGDGHPPGGDLRPAARRVPGSGCRRDAAVRRRPPRTRSPAGRDSPSRWPTGRTRSSTSASGATRMRCARRSRRARRPTNP